jgi:ribosomal protein S18 acetylase RimI-like enzyme
VAGWHIRRARPSDASGLTTCVEAAYAPIRARGVALPDVSEGLSEDIARNLVWVAEDAGRIVGGIVVVLHPDHAHLVNVAVDPGCRGTGLGRALIETAEAAMRTAGVTEFRLATHADLPENVVLYRRLGWQVFGQDESRIFMHRFLRRDQREGSE